MRPNKRKTGLMMMSLLGAPIAASLWMGLEAALPATEVQTLAWDMLTGAVADEKPARRIQAIAALGSIGIEPRVVRLIEKTLNDPSPEVREIGAATLGEMRSRASIPKLRLALQDERPEVSFTAAKALWDMGDYSGRSIFMEVMTGERSDSPEGMSAAVQDAKKKLRSPGALALMGAKEAAGLVLGPFAFGITLAEELKKDSSAPARSLSAALLGTDSDPGSLRVLEQALSDKNWVVRVSVARSLGKRSNRSSIPKLGPLLNDEKEAVRYMAAASIVRLSRYARAQAK